MKILNLESGTPFSMGKGKNWSVLNPGMGAELITLNHGIHLPGHEFPQHIHDGSEDVIVVLAGGVHLRQGEVYTPLEAGEAALVPAGEVHGTVNRSGQRARLISFQIPPDLALYRGERNKSDEDTPKPETGTVSTVQIVELGKGSPSFPGTPLLRNIFAPHKGSEKAVLDFIRLRADQAYDYNTADGESVFVLIGGQGRVSHGDEDRELSPFDVVFLNRDESVSIRQSGDGPADLLCCHAE
jgi:quercetin dioxygenase-like cupin family protein